ncbi:hypothetical protein D3C73_1493870 [compost metagenome]
MQILLELITLVVSDHRRGATGNRAFNCLANKTPILHLRQRNLVHVTATLRTDLNQAVLSQFDECFAYWLA